jgi:hypothetical protein
MRAFEASAAAVAQLGIAAAVCTSQCMRSVGSGASATP